MSHTLIHRHSNMNSTLSYCMPLYTPHSLHPRNRQIHPESALCSSSHGHFPSYLQRNQTSCYTASHSQFCMTHMPEFRSEPYILKPPRSAPPTIWVFSYHHSSLSHILYLVSLCDDSLYLPGSLAKCLPQFSYVIVHNSGPAVVVIAPYIHEQFIP